MYDFIGMGELLTDLTPCNNINNELSFVANPGGAPANVTTILSHYGNKCAFIGMVGKDTFGYLCKSYLEKYGVDTSMLKMSSRYSTSLAFIHLTPSGDRQFLFYRDPSFSADIHISAKDLDYEKIRNTKIFHFGSVSLSGQPARSATLKALTIARRAGAIISFDPNIRLSLWKDKKRIRKEINSVLNKVDIFKLSDEELKFLFNMDDIRLGAKLIYSRFKTKLIIITMANKGSYALYNGKDYTNPAYDMKIIDTTGAGDSFLAVVLHKILENNGELSECLGRKLDEIFCYANAAGALTSSKKGAMSEMPSWEDIMNCKQNNQQII